MCSLPSARRRLWVHTKYHADKTRQNKIVNVLLLILMICVKRVIYFFVPIRDAVVVWTDCPSQWCIIWGSITLNLFQTQPSPVKFHVGTPCFLLSSLSQHGGSGRFPCAKENGPYQYFGVVFPANRKLNTTSCYFSVLNWPLFSINLCITSRKQWFILKVHIIAHPTAWFQNLTHLQKYRGNNLKLELLALEFDVVNTT